MQWNRTTIYKSLNLSATIATTPLFYCCEDSIRTSDLKVMSLASYQTALPRDEEKDWEELRNKQGLNAPLFHKIPNEVLPPAPHSI